uniref:Uncharacterized protein n=1 Tax=Octopus bimaculoides TaxID=37653 RepID=A0A0L8HWB3_OCTBM
MCGSKYKGKRTYVAKEYGGKGLKSLKNVTSIEQRNMNSNQNKIYTNTKRKLHTHTQTKNMFYENCAGIK